MCLRLSGSVTKLVRGVSGHELTVLIDGEVVKDPHLVTIDMTNIGPGDLTASQFADGRALAVTLYGIDADTGEQVRNVIEIPPMLLKIRDKTSYELITSGARGVMIAHKDDVIANADLVARNREGRQRPVSTRRMGRFITILGSLAAVLFSFLLIMGETSATSDASPRWPLIILTVILPMIYIALILRIEKRMTGDVRMSKTTGLFIVGL